MKNLRIGIRLALGFATVLLLMAAIAGISVWRLQEVGENTNYMVSSALGKERLASEWFTETSNNAIRTFALAKTADPDEQRYFQSQIKAGSARISELQKKIEEQISMPEEKALLATVGSRRTAYIAARDAAFKLRAAGDEAGMSREVGATLSPAMAAYVESIRQMLLFEKEEINRSAARINRAYESGRLLVIGLTALALMAGALFSWLLARGIVRPLQEAVSVARQVATGDLTARVTVSATDETGQLMAALKEMNESLGRTVSTVRNGADTIATASREIASGNMDLSSRTEEQASALEQTAASMEELASTVRQNADNARQANELAAQAMAIASRGGEVVFNVVGTMGAIDTSARKIVDIISVIDGIAFQTNILALNAAVEAARAGEQGRGFAVVATEVRGLARRSADAAKEIKHLIGDSVEKVDAGAKLVDEAGTTMNQVVDSVRKVAEIMREIAGATNEQSAGIEQVNQAVTQMDQVTQQNAALVEEAAAAAESMQDQAAQLARTVSLFRLTDTQGASAVKSVGLTTSAVPAGVARQQPASPVQLVASRPSPTGKVDRLPVDRTRQRTAVTVEGDWEKF